MLFLLFDFLYSPSERQQQQFHFGGCAVGITSKLCNTTPMRACVCVCVQGTHSKKI